MKVIIRHNGILFLILRDITRIKLHGGMVISSASIYNKHGYICGLFEANGITYEVSLED